MRFYCGIGSRQSPKTVLRLMEECGTMFAERGWTLYSGGAGGADCAFEKGCTDAGGLKQIFLPWEGFNMNDSPHYKIPADAFKIAKEIHPAWNRLSQGSQKLHARNVMQILGEDLDTPTNIVICWTNGSGGTMTAVNLAKSHNIPVINFHTSANLKTAEDVWDKTQKLLKKVKP